MSFPSSDHFNGKTFFTPGAPSLVRWREILRWKFSRHEVATWPRWIDAPPVVAASPSGTATGAAKAPAVTATWINHSSFLLQTGGVNLLLDPVYSRHCGPFGLLGPRRVHAPGIAFDALPRIDAVLLSHDHYDHCDLATLRRLARRDAPAAFAPLGHRDLFRRAGFADARIRELDWWETAELGGDPERGGIRVTLTPAQHWSKRLSSPRCRRLWGGFFLETRTPVSAGGPGAGGTENAAARRVYFAGDSGYHAAIFRDIGARLGAPDLALLPIGAYEPRWFMSPQHCNPAEAVRMHLEVGAKLSVAMHWGAFQLTDEARDEPPRALRAALREAGLPPEVFGVLEPGASVTI
ncbi:MBL fold metallo-hydrolase [Termitidicoccus mucosus]|uniref:MBL fold metallo-hydrolase n=1 Tax=Termitidicoccus mucosus TaxID=1184151 RepID=UPI002FEDEF94